MVRTLSSAFIARTKVVTRITRFVTVDAGFAVANKISIVEVFTLELEPSSHCEFPHEQVSCTRHRPLWQGCHGLTLTFLLWTFQALAKFRFTEPRETQTRLYV